MEDVRIGDLATMSPLDTTYFVAVDKSGSPTALKLGLDIVIQTLSFDPATMELEISDGNIVDLGPALTPRYSVFGGIINWLTADTYTVQPFSCLDDTGTYTISLDTTYTKSKAAWAAGSLSGSLDTGTIAANQTYYVFAIYNSTTDKSDILLSLSETSPTPPAGYGYKMILGVIKTYFDAASFDDKSVVSFMDYQQNDENGKPLPTNYVSDITITKSGGSNFTVYDFECRDYDDNENIVFHSILGYATKTTSTFSAGAGGGAMEAAIVVDENYYVYAIAKAEGKNPDIYISTSLWPTPPVGYTMLQMIGRAQTDSSGTMSISNPVMFGEQLQSNKKTTRLVTGNYTLDPLFDEVLMVNTAAGDVTITVPLKTSLPNDQYLHEYWIYKISNDVNKVIIQLSGSETFPLGYTKHILLYAEENIHLGGNYVSGWSKISYIKIVNDLERTSTWAAASFAGGNPVPFESNPVSDNENILYWDSPTNPTRLYCTVPIRINVAYHYTIDSTGGTDWTCEAYIRKNGTTQISNTVKTIGNDGFLPNSDTLPPVPVDLAAGDYIELFLDNTSLTGNLTSASLIVDTII